MRKKRKPSGIGKKIRIASAVAVFVTLCGVWLATWLKQPYTAVMFAVCGKPIGAVVVLHNGSQDFYKLDDPELLTLTAKIPKERKGMLQASGPYCTQSPEQKVY